MIFANAALLTALEAATKLILAFGMFLGRLELLTGLVLLPPAFWREV